MAALTPMPRGVRLPTQIQEPKVEPAVGKKTSGRIEGEGTEDDTSTMRDPSSERRSEGTPAADVRSPSRQGSSRAGADEPSGSGATGTVGEDASRALKSGEERHGAQNRANSSSREATSGLRDTNDGDGSVNEDMAQQRRRAGRDVGFSKTLPANAEVVEASVFSLNVVCTGVGELSSPGSKGRTTHVDIKTALLSCVLKAELLFCPLLSAARATVSPPETCSDPSVVVGRFYRWTIATTNYGYLHPREVRLPTPAG